MKLYSQRFCAFFRRTRIVCFALCVLIGVFDQCLFVYAADENPLRSGSTLQYYGYGSKFTYNAAISSPGLAGGGGSTGEYGAIAPTEEYTGLVDLKIPICINNNGGSIFSKNGLYTILSNNGGNIFVDVSLPYSSPFQVGYFSLRSFNIENSSGECLGRLTGQDISVGDGAPSKDVFQDVSNYKTGSSENNYKVCRYRFNYSFYNSNIYFYGSTSENIFLHVVFDVKDMFLCPSLILDFDLSNVKFNGSGRFVSDVTDSNVLSDIDATIKEQHQEEIDSSNSAGDNLGSTLTDVTGTLSSIEILKLPWTMLTDLFNAIQGDGQTTLTFPSFSLMGETLWPEYTFDLVTIDTNFPVLTKSVRLVSGIFLCLAFSHYIRHFFERIFGNQESEEDV